MASQVQITQGRNSLAEALSNALSNVGTAVGKGFQRSEQMSMASNALTAQQLTEALDRERAQGGGMAFDPAINPNASNNLAMLSTMLTAREKMLGRALSPDERQAYITSYTGANLAPGAKFQYLVGMGFMPDEAQRAVETGTIPQKAPAQTANAAPSATSVTPSAAPSAPAPSTSAPGESPLNLSATGQRIRAFGQTGALSTFVGGGGMSPTLVVNPQLNTLIQKYPVLGENINQAVKARNVRDNLGMSQVIGEEMAKLAEFSPIFAQESLSILNGFDSALNQPSPAQPQPTQPAQPTLQRNPAAGSPPLSAKNRALIEGMQANGTRTLAQHEARTGDEHYPARVGVEEGIVNAIAMRQPGVADIVMELNRRFPADVATSRGTYADGVPNAPSPSLTAYYGDAQPPTMQRALPPLTDPNMQAAPLDMPPPAPNEAERYNAVVSSASPDAALSPLQILKAKGIALDAPAPSTRTERMWDLVRQHAADVQAKYQINFADPDPRERAILSRELRVEQQLVRNAVASDTGRKAWARDQTARLKNYLTSASDEELATVFGPDVAQARHNTRSRDLEKSAQQLQWAIAAMGKDTADQMVGTLAMEALKPSYDFFNSFVGKDKNGQATWNSEAVSKALDQFSLPKSTVDILSLMYGLDIPGAAKPTVEEKRIWFLNLGKKYGFEDIYSNTGQVQGAATAAAPAAGNAEADAFMNGKR